jgi:hypothetical protein
MVKINLINEICRGWKRPKKVSRCLRRVKEKIWRHKEGRELFVAFPDRRGCQADFVLIQPGLQQ